MNVKDYLEACGTSFYAGVPDSQLKALCDFLYENYGISDKHIIAANEGNAVGLAAGYYMSTGKIPMVYMQNSGIGNVVNPVCSLLNDKVYAIPCIFTVGWRGEPGVHDEPQHIFQGEVTVKLMEDLDISTFILSKETEPSEVKAFVEKSKERFDAGKSIAFIVRKGALSYEGKPDYSNENLMTREHIIEKIAAAAKDGIFVSTTGKASRELFEIRERNGEGHEKDFLTVGSMGHSSSIAMSIALRKPESRIWCIDGDGAALMHMGSMAVVGEMNPSNMVHIVINNGAHETVGGQPTAMKLADLPAVAKACGYKKVLTAANDTELEAALTEAGASKVLTFLEIKAKNGARADLGRPTLTAKQNVDNFMNYLKTKN